MPINKPRLQPTVNSIPYSPYKLTQSGCLYSTSLLRSQTPRCLCRIYTILQSYQSISSKLNQKPSTRVLTIMKWLKPIAFSLFTSIVTINAADASFERALETYKAGNYAEAKTAFEAMAAIGDKNSLFNLGVMYLKGQAVEQDLVEAYAMFKLSGSVDANGKAQEAVRNMLSKTQKVEADKRFSDLTQI